GNVIDWQGSPAGMMQVNAGAGNDTINVGDTNNTLDGFLGTPALDGQGGSNTVHIDDQGSASTHTYQITNSTVSRDGSPGTYANVASLVLNGGSGADNYNIVSTALGTATTVNGGPANDAFSIGSAGNRLDA